MEREKGKGKTRLEAAVHDDDDGDDENALLKKGTTASVLLSKRTPTQLFYFHIRW